MSDVLDEELLEELSDDVVADEELGVMVDDEDM